MQRGLSGVEEKGRAAYRQHGQIRCQLLSAMCATKHNGTERNGSGATGTTRASTDLFLREVWAGLEQSWSGAECSEAEEH